MKQREEEEEEESYNNLWSVSSTSSIKLSESSKEKTAQSKKKCITEHQERHQNFGDESLLEREDVSSSKLKSLNRWSQESKSHHQHYPKRSSLLLTPSSKDRFSSHSDVRTPVISPGSSSTKHVTFDEHLVFLDCARNGEVAEVSQYLEKKDIIHTRNEDGLTALHLACQYGHLEIVRMLLQHGADVNSRDIDNWTPLHFAALENNTAIVQELLAYHANLDGKDAADSSTNCDDVSNQSSLLT
jgi:hypothetical protein